jgi:hypothetical protein
MFYCKYTLCATLMYLLIPVQRVDDELHHAVDLGLEGVILGPVPDLSHLRHTQLVWGDGLLLSQDSFCICEDAHF